MAPEGGDGVVVSHRLRYISPRHRRFWRSRPRVVLVVGAAILCAGLVISVAQPILPLRAPDQLGLTEPLAPPSIHNLFGTDSLGRDLFSRTIAAGKVDLGVALAVTWLSLVIGVTLGAVAGLAGGAVEALIMRVADAVLAFPFLVFIIAVIAIVGPGLTGVLIAIPLAGWALYARVTRGEMLRVREQDYLVAARTLGFSRSRVLIRHALPNTIRPAIVISMADVVLNVLLLASLSYLGLGVQPPTPEWGAIIADGQTYLLQAWWVSTLPGLILLLTGAVLSLMGDALADLLDDDSRTVL